MNAATKKILDDLKNSGFDVSSIETQAQRNPLLDRAADSVIGGGVLRRQEFTTYKEQKDDEVKQLQTQVRELAAAHDSAEGFKGNDALYNAALEKIKVLEDNLINEGFDPTEVRSLSFQEKEGLKNAISQAATKETQKVEDRKVPDDNNYVDVNTFQTVAANLAGGNLISTVKIQSALMQAQKLGIEVTPELEDAFGKNLIKGMESQKSFEQIADETFGFAAKRAEIDATNRKKEVDAQVEEQLAAKLREAGVNPATVRGNKPKSIFDNYTGRLGVDASAENAIAGEGGTVVLRGRKLPANKFGHAEFYKLRGDRGTRVAHAIESMEKLQEKQPDLFEEVY